MLGQGWEGHTWVPLGGPDQHLRTSCGRRRGSRGAAGGRQVACVRPGRAAPTRRRLDGVRQAGRGANTGARRGAWPVAGGGQRWWRGDGAELRGGRRGGWGRPGTPAGGAGSFDHHPGGGRGRRTRKRERNRQVNGPVQGPDGATWRHREGLSGRQGRAGQAPHTGVGAGSRRGAAASRRSASHGRKGRRGPAQGRACGGPPGWQPGAKRSPQRGAVCPEAAARADKAAHQHNQTLSTATRAQGRRSARWASAARAHGRNRRVPTSAAWARIQRNKEYICRIRA